MAEPTQTPTGISITQQRTQRPNLKQYIDYTTSPSYIKHEAEEDRLAILVCQIKIWKAKGNNWFDIPKASDTDRCLVIRECESIEITESAKEIISKAVVRFPRGTVINVTKKADKKTQVSETDGGGTMEKDLPEATNYGELLTTDTSRYSDGTSTTSAASNYSNKGLLQFNRTKTETALLSANDIAIDNRIEIRLGYAYSEDEYNKMNSSDGLNMDIAFTGFITSMSVDTPLELNCMNMAYVFTTFSTPDVPASNTATVADFLDDGGKHHILEGTGIKLADHCKGSDIVVSGAALNTNLTVADVLNTWIKSGISCQMYTKSDGSVDLRVGFAYFTGGDGDKLPSNNKKYITYRADQNLVPLLHFDWDVAEDKLQIKHVDKNFLAIRAHARTKNNQIFSLVVRKNPDLDTDGWLCDEDNGNFQIVNQHQQVPYKKQKAAQQAGSPTHVDHKLTNRSRLKEYVVVDYYSTTVGISDKDLQEEAKQYWNRYNANGISGSISIFGDVYVKPTDVVGLVDLRQPQKNGYYFVESVSTSFGTNGYRRELKLPHKMSSFKNNITII